MIPLTEPYLWLIAGMVLLALEAFGIPGVGMVFAGLAAIVTGTLVGAGLVEESDHLAQFSWWFAVTAISAILLWKPMKRWRMKPGEQEYSNMVGSTAVVFGGDLVKGKIGKAKWSGAIMQAELAANAGVETLKEGETAEVTGVEGNTLKLKPRT